MDDIRLKPYGNHGRVKKLYYYVCPKCGKQFWIDERTYKRKLTTGENCQSCLRSIQCKKMIDKRNSNMSPEEKADMIRRLHAGAKRYRDNMSDDERKRLSEIKSKAASEEMKQRWKDPKYRERKSKLASEQMLAEWSNRTVDKRKEMISKLHSGRDEYFSNGNDSARRAKLSLALTGKPNAYWANLSDEERCNRINKFLENVKYKRENMTDSERLEYSQKLSDAQKSYWSTKSDDDRKERADFLKRIHDDWWNSLSDADKVEYGLKHSEISKEYWNSLSDSEFREMMKKSVLLSQGTNKLHTKFINLCKDIAPGYKLCGEYITGEDGFNHAWDYALFNNDELVMLVDLDGEFYHADKCDYDGMHSHLKYDERRGMSIPHGVKHCIIREKFFDIDFDWFKWILPMPFGEFVDTESKILSSMPFPHPFYSDSELMNSLDHLFREDLSTRYPYDENRFGDRVIQHFANSLYDEKIWVPEWIHNAVEHHIIYHPHTNRNKILQPIIQSYISPYMVRHIIRNNGYDGVFDPYSNMAIMLGAIAAGVAYRTTPVDYQHFLELSSLLSFFLKYRIPYNVEFTRDDKFHNIKEDINEDKVF